MQQITQNSIILPNSLEISRTEKNKRNNALNLDYIKSSLFSKCKVTHDEFKCDGNCLYKFSSPDILVDLVVILRKKIWDSNLGQKSSKIEGRDLRNCVVLSDFLSHRFKDDTGKYQIQFVINGIQVCKDFYLKSTGISKKSFSALYNYVTNKNCTTRDDYFDKLLKSPMLSSFQGDIKSIIKNRPSKSSNIIDTSLKDNVLAFLDIQFANGIDFAPENNRDRYTHLSWNELFLLYKSYCTQVCIRPADYTFFCKIR